ncbi:glycosyltransferase family 2 protein [Candidatus Woesearchaeota archaeon]|nr:glycosyltransferase family 2 protein [Candidatus Woesearchaeota archaeon]
MGEKVLVGVPTFAGDSDKREIFFNYLSKLSYPELRFVFATNSGLEDKKDLEAHAERVGIRIIVLLNDDEGIDRFDYIINNRNLIREYFLVSKYPWLYFLDSDVVGPLNAIEVLLKHEKKLTTGWYLGVFDSGGKPVVKPTAYAFFKEGFARQLSIKEVLMPRFIPLAAAGLGCCLIHREILEKINFHKPEGKGGEDAAFFKDSREICEKRLWLDTRVKYWHLKFPMGDKRNNIYDPRRYQLKNTKTS